MVKMLKNSFSKGTSLLRRIPRAKSSLADAINSENGLVNKGSSSVFSVLGGSHDLSTGTCHDPLMSNGKTKSPIFGYYGARFRSFATGPALVDMPSLTLPSSKKVIDQMAHYGQCFWELSKARLSILVVATSGAGFVLGSPHAVDWATLCWTCTGTMMVAASANSFNQIFEIENDSKMKRTMRRPLPSGRLTPSVAVAWAVTVGSLGNVILATEANYLAAGLAASNLALYTLAYTPLKQIHPINTWVGAIVGAIPPLIGWVAATGGISLDGLVLPAVLYFWQLPHFMALAYLCRDDYAAGGYKMLSLHEINGGKTSIVALRNCLYLLPLGFIAYDWNLTSKWFGMETVLMTTGMSAAALIFYLNRNTKNARRLFHASLLYLPLFMAGMLFHRLPKSNEASKTGNAEDRLIVDVNAISDQIKPKKKRVTEKRHLPPIAYASAAPFPFLPVPYFPSES